MILCNQEGPRSFFILFQQQRANKRSTVISFILFLFCFVILMRSFAGAVRWASSGERKGSPLTTNTLIGCVRRTKET